jgi:hypothetical protein
LHYSFVQQELSPVHASNVSSLIGSGESSVCVTTPQITSSAAIKGVLLK